MIRRATRAESGVCTLRSAQARSLARRSQLRAWTYMFMSWIVTTFGPGQRSGKKYPGE